MQITFINVGYGDAILLQTASGYTALIDGGSALESEFANAPFRIRAADYLRRQGITHLDLLILSHIHEDHVCGLEAIAQQVSIDRIYVPYPVEPFLHGSDLTADATAPRSVILFTSALHVYQRLLQNAHAKGTPIEQIKAGNQFDLPDGLKLSVLAPFEADIATFLSTLEQAYAQGDQTTNCLAKLDATSNQVSLLLKLESDGVSTLLTADNCLRDWEEIPIPCLDNVNVLKVPHHGQIDCFSEYYMHRMPLQYVITTASSDRRYHSANAVVYEQLSALFSANCQPHFLFSDERNYPPLLFSA